MAELETVISGQIAEVTFDLSDVGFALSGATGSLHVRDELEDDVYDYPIVGATLTPDSSGLVTFMIPSYSMTLTDVHATSGARVFVLKLQSGTATFLRKKMVIVQAEARLRPWETSFGTETQLHMALSTMPTLNSGMDDLKRLSESEFVSIMEMSFDQLSRLYLVAVKETEQDDEILKTYRAGEVFAEFHEMTTAEKSTLLGRKMRKALVHAQVLNASEIISLTNDPIVEMRRKGVISQTVGESSQFYGKGTSGDDPDAQIIASVAAKTMLGPWIKRVSLKIGRA